LIKEELPNGKSEKSSRKSEGEGGDSAKKIATEATL